MEKYHSFMPLSTGSYGQIFTATHAESGKDVVLKRLSKSNNWKRIENEIIAGIELQNVKGTPHFHEYLETENSFVSKMIYHISARI
jgi:serine/threonine protein kinase